MNEQYQIGNPILAGPRISKNSNPSQILKSLVINTQLLVLVRCKLRNPKTHAYSCLCQVSL